MKLLARAGVLALALCGAMTTALLQAQVVAQSALPTEPAPTTPPPSTPPPPTPVPTPPPAPAIATPVRPPPVVVETPPPIHIETKVDLRSPPGPPADPRAVREEAVNALHWAKSEGCRSAPSPRDCIRRAQDDYNAAMARLGGHR